MRNRLILCLLTVSLFVSAIPSTGFAGWSVSYRFLNSPSFFLDHTLFTQIKTGDNRIVVASLHDGELQTRCFNYNGTLLWEIDSAIPDFSAQRGRLLLKYDVECGSYCLLSYQATTSESRFFLQRIRPDGICLPDIIQETGDFHSVHDMIMTPADCQLILQGEHALRLDVYDSFFFLSNSSELPFSNSEEIAPLPLAAGASGLLSLLPISIRNTDTEATHAALLQIVDGDFEWIFNNAETDQTFEALKMRSENQYAALFGNESGIALCYLDENGAETDRWENPDHLWQQCEMQKCETDSFLITGKATTATNSCLFTADQGFKPAFETLGQNVYFARDALFSFGEASISRQAFNGDCCWELNDFVCHGLVAISDTTLVAITSENATVDSPKRLLLIKEMFENLPPDAAQLLAPEDNAIVQPAELNELTLVWQRADDPDPGQEPSYLVHTLFLTSDQATTCCDTTIFDTTLSVRALCQANAINHEIVRQILWDVSVVSSGDTVRCEAPFHVSVSENTVTSTANLPAHHPHIERIYPQPTNATATIIISDINSDEQLLLYNLLGQLVWSQNLPHQKSCRITLPKSLPSGHYFIALKNSPSKPRRLIIIR